MVEFTTIYRKDYLWPELKEYFPREDITCRYALPIDPKTSEPISIPNKQECLHDLNWKRREPSEVEKRNVKPEDGKLNLGTCPNTQILEYPKTETEACLKKLLQDNPNLYQILKKIPPDDAIKKFNVERLRSTYQVDFGHKTEPELTITLPAQPEPCPMDGPAPVQPDCKPSLHARAALLRLRHKEMNELLNKPCCPKCESNRLARLYKDKNKPPQFMLKVVHGWTSEYRDTINRPGNEIMKMHSKRIMKIKRFNKGRGLNEDCRQGLTFA